jgi:hypothetical protein
MKNDHDLHVARRTARRIRMLAYAFAYQRRQGISTPIVRISTITFACASRSDRLHVLARMRGAGVYCTPYRDAVSPWAVAGDITKARALMGGAR